MCHKLCSLFPHKKEITHVLWYHAQWSKQHIRKRILKLKRSVTYQWTLYPARVLFSWPTTGLLLWANSSYVPTVQWHELSCHPRLGILNLSQSFPHLLPWFFSCLHVLHFLFLCCFHHLPAPTLHLSFLLLFHSFISLFPGSVLLTVEPQHFHSWECSDCANGSVIRRPHLLLLASWNTAAAAMRVKDAWASLETHYN